MPKKFKIDKSNRHSYPYLFRRIEGNTFQAVNRDYKDIDWPETFSIDPARLDGVWTNSSDPNALYLYSDNPVDQINYLDRYKRLWSFVIR